MRASLSFVLVLVLVLVLVASADDAARLYLDQDKVTVAEPAFDLTRPDKDWVFVDIAAQREARAKERPAAEVETEFGPMRARLWSETLRALLTVWTRPIGSPAPDVAALEKSLKEDVERRKGQLVELVRVKVDGAEGVRADWLAAIEVPLQPGQRALPGASNVYRYSRVDLLRPGSKAILTFFFEAPKERWSKAAQGWSKILKRVELK